VDDFADQLERMVGGEAEPDERDVGVFSCGDGADFFDVDFACDHLVAEPGDDLCEELEPVASLVGDQDTKPHDAVLDQRLIVGTRDKCHRSNFSGLLHRPFARGFRWLARQSLGPTSGIGREGDGATVVSGAANAPAAVTARRPKPIRFAKDPPSAEWVGAVIDLGMYRSATKLTQR
jgi:hypothetical protein